jgi:hypothetical protein
MLIAELTNKTACGFAKKNIYQVQVGSKLPTPRYISYAANDALRIKARPTCGV